MEVLGAGAYIAVPMRRFRTSFGVVSFEGYAVHNFSVGEVCLGCILLPPGSWRSWVGPSIRVVDEVNTAIFLSFFV